MPPRKSKTVAAREQPPRDRLACCTILCDTPACASFFPCTEGVTHDMTWVLAFNGGWSHDASGLRRCPSCTAMLSGWKLAESGAELPWNLSLYEGDLAVLFAAIDEAFGPVQQPIPAPEPITETRYTAEVLEVNDEDTAIIDAEEITEDTKADEAYNRLHDAWQESPDTSDHGFAIVKIPGKSK
jgi:hypothetical protein